MGYVEPGTYVECYYCYRPLPPGTTYSGSRPKCWQCEQTYK